MTDGITNLDDCKAWVKEKYPMRGHKTGEMIRSLITEVELLRLATSQLEAKVYHTAPGQLEFAPEGWTWQQQCRAEHDRYVEIEAECEAQSQRAASRDAEVKALREAIAGFVNAPKSEHLVTRLNDAEMAAFEKMKALTTKGTTDGK